MMTTSDTAEHLAAKAELHEVSLAAHLVYDHNQPVRLPATRKGLVDLHGRLHEPMAKDAAQCSCAQHGDGSVTTSLCPLHAEQDPCLTMATVTGRRRRGSVVRGVCSACGWSASSKDAAP